MQPLPLKAATLASSTHTASQNARSGQPILNRLWPMLSMIALYALYECYQHSMGGSSSPDVLLAPPGTVALSPCDGIKNMDCGFVVVPKDYFDPSSGTAQIALARYKATKSPKRGTIMLNPGGPGGSGKQLLASRFGGELLSGMLGEDYDLVGFDPRGIGETRPKTQCFSNPRDYTLFIANTVFERSFQVPNPANLTSDTRASLVEQNKEFLALKEAQAGLCAKNMGDELKFMGSANVVRDMDFMTRVFDGKDAKINYFGASYGSILGMYLANMLPDRVGYVNIDGIADPVSWASQPSHKWHRGWINSAEATYDMYLRDCAEAGPALCALVHRHGESAKDVDNRIERFFSKLNSNPLPIPQTPRPGYLTSSSVRALFLTVLERPAFWPAWSRALSEAMSGDGRAVYNSLPGVSFPESLADADLSRLGVTCADSPPPESKKDFPTAEDLADELMGTMQKVSSRFGAHVHLGEQDGGCQFWPTAGRGPERFAGPWNHTLEVPMLITSNTHDPITPMASALLVNSIMPNSTLLLQEGPGHCTLALPSICTLKLRKGYFQGVIPKNGTRCSVDAKTFPDPTEVRSMSAEDRNLLEIAEKLQTLWSTL